MWALGEGTCSPSLRRFFSKPWQAPLLTSSHHFLLLQPRLLQSVIALLFCGIDVASTGVLLALKDTFYVAQAMAVSLAVLAGFLWWTRQAGAAVSLHIVWWGLVVFFGLRAAQSFPRVVYKYLRC